MVNWYSHYQKEQDVWIQDQITGYFHRYFMTEEKTDIILTTAASKGDKIISVSSDHGITSEDCLLIVNGNYTQQVIVVSVSNDDITINYAIGKDLSIADTTIIRGSIEMNIDASGTPVTFYCRPYVNIPVDILHIHIFFTDNLEGDDSKYGGIGALTNGSYCRQEDGDHCNLGLYKSNRDFIEHGAISKYTNKAGGGNYTMDFAFNTKEPYGIVLRLDPEKGEFLSFTIQDDLTDLISHRVVATGHLTKGE